MRYALRKQDKIAEAYGNDYLQQHIIASLDAFFKTAKEITTDRFIDASSGVRFPLIAVNDVADEDCMLCFAVTGVQYDVFRLAFAGREKF